MIKQDVGLVVNLIELNVKETIMRPVIFFISILFLQGILSYTAHAQRTYITRKGTLVAKTLKGDSLVTHEFNNINVLLDYDKAEVVINFKLDDSLDDHIPSNRFFYDYDVAINSRLSLSEIETQSHPDRNFNIQGHLIYNEAAYYLTGDGVLEHIEGGEALACLLTMNIKLMEGTTLVLDNYGQVEDIFLLQTVLNQEVLDEWGKVGY
ncbi:hypothetical protein Belba_1297 [Belliella baltica DSM 15883]|uniref:Uncharacterized protein n=1 Tax=Belliella baltica (strain DSM 15883 / CIP 108006 / LMG 21964 / BA134) TaxID=866536 RepID=I3Z3V6_BELBD|nr:hypothetical protein [Belliella baltica]AFL83924.1 hypothetical protein Belba_1297 [Belliella baltica DSM 15883]